MRTQKSRLDVWVLNKNENMADVPGVHGEQVFCTAGTEDYY